MQRNSEIDFVLTGAKTGKTIVLNRHVFRGGVARIVVSPENADAVLTYLARSYQAYPAGSAQLAQAQQRDHDNGLRSSLPPDSPPSDGASDTVQGAPHSEAGSVPGEGVLQRGVDADSETGSEGFLPGGSGHEDTGLGERVESAAKLESDAIRATTSVAIAKLDPTNDEHWTEGGLPSVAYLAEATRNPSLTRELISMCAPGFNREKAEDVAAL